MADDAPSRPSALGRVHPVVWVLVGLAVPAFLAVLPLPQPAIPMGHRQEVAALQQLVTIQRAQTRYFSRFGRFATKLEDLGPTGANLVPGDLAKGIKGGYQFTVIGGPTGHTINANPITGSTGRRTFFSDQSNVIRQNWGPEPATVNSPEIK